VYDFDPQFPLGAVASGAPHDEALLDEPPGGSAAVAACSSWTVPMTALICRTVKMKAASIPSPMISETTAAASSR